MKARRIFLLLFFLSAVASAADFWRKNSYENMLLRACVASVNAVMPPEQDIASIQSKGFSRLAEIKQRRVALHVLTTTKMTRKYACRFFEEANIPMPFYLYSPWFFGLEVDEKDFVSKVGGDGPGTTQDWDAAHGASYDVIHGS